MKQDVRAEIPLPEKWTRIYFREGGDYLDFDANAYAVLMEALDEEKKYATIITTHGETYVVVMETVGCIAKRNKTALVRIWQESAEWERFRKENEGWSDDD